jgi:hypothetical protein
VKSKFKRSLKLHKASCLKYKSFICSSSSSCYPLASSNRGSSTDGPLASIRSSEGILGRMGEMDNRKDEREGRAVE